jgi:hypothetical protein
MSSVAKRRLPLINIDQVWEFYPPSKLFFTKEWTICYDWLGRLSPSPLSGLLT